MRATLLPDRGVVKVAGDGARNFLHGLVTTDIRQLRPGKARFGALLTPQGKIIADFMVVEAPAADGGGFFLDIARQRIAALVERFNLYKLRAKIIVEDLSEILGVLAAWDGMPVLSEAGNPREQIGLAYTDPRVPQLGVRVMLSPHRAAAASSGLGATLVEAPEYDVYRIALGIPRGGVDFSYGAAFPHEADMDQLGGVDFEKGCYVGQEVVSRMEHRGTARTRTVPVSFDGPAPVAGAAVTAGDRQLGHLSSAAAGNGIAMLRLDRVADAFSHGQTLSADGTPIRLVKPDWARFAFPGESEAAE